MIKRFLSILLLVFGMACAALAQDSVRVKKDSLQNIALDRQLLKIRQLSAEKLSDSLKQETLEKKVAQLSNADNLKRAGLLKELSALKQNDSLRVFLQKHQIDSLRRFIKGFPVSPYRDTLFYLFTRQGSFTAQERAEAIDKRIIQLSKVYQFNQDSLRLISAETSTDVVYKDMLLLSVSQADALWENLTTQKLADSLRLKIIHAIILHKQETRWQTLLTESLEALLTIIITVLLIYGINRFFKLLLDKIKRSKSWLAGGIKIRNYQLLNAERQQYILSFVFKIIKWFLVILVIYLALPILFGIFPFTRDLSGLLVGYVTSPLKRIGLAVWHYIPNLVTILVLLFIFRYVLLFFAYLKNEIEKGALTLPGFYADWANPTYQIVRVLVLAFMLIVVFPYLPGSDSAVFKGVSVFVGVLFTFGSAGALSNIVSGIVMTYMRAFKIGDRVKIGEVTGDIIEKTLLATRIRTIQNEIVSIPNSTVMSSHTLNYSSDAPVHGLILHTSVTIGYDSPWRQVHQLLIDAALATPMVETDPKPYVYQTSLDDYYVSYRINAFTREPNRQAAIYSALHANIQDKFNEAGVEIMSPHYKSLRDGNAITIPPEYLPKDYVPPGFVTQQRKSE